MAAGLFGCVGLVTDVGLMEYYRRKAQVAADAGAIGGAAELMSGSTNLTAAVNLETANNSFTDGVDGTTVAIHRPPSSGVYAGRSTYVEVVVTKSAPTWFMKAIGVDHMVVRARAVAGPGAATGCVYVLNNSASGALTINGGGSLSSVCGVMVNSNHAKAITLGGNACLTATYVNVTGNMDSNSSCAITVPTTGVPAIQDPLAAVQAPVFNPSCDFINADGSGRTLNPGVYCNGIKISGSTATFNPGTYILLGGGLSVSGGASLTGTGVTFYNTYNSTYSYKAISVTGGSLTNISAPTSGPLTGILFFQDRSVVSTAQNMITGSSSGAFTGALYFPNSPLVYSGGSESAAAYTILVADKITISGSSHISNDYSALSGGSPVTSGTAGVAE